MFNAKNTYIPSSCKVLLKIFNDSTTSRLILLVFVPERCGTHDLNFNKDGMLHKNKVHFQNYFKLSLALSSGIKKIVRF